MPTCHHLDTRKPATVRRLIAMWAIGLALEASVIWIYLLAGLWERDDLLTKGVLLVVPFHLGKGTWDWWERRREQSARE